MARKHGRVSVATPLVKDVATPSEITIEMDSSVPLAGVVRNESGEGISRARVSLSILAQRPPGTLRPHIDLPAPTNSSGRWRCADVPSEFDGTLVVRVEHPDYIPVVLIGEEPFGVFSRRVSEVTLKDGVPVTGRIVDTLGHPIEAASVQLGSRLDPNTRVRTDAEGRFRAGKSKPGNWSSRYRHEATRRYFEALPSKKVRPRLNFTLRPGKTIRGKVVNNRGAPVTGALVGVSEWRGHASLDLGGIATDSSGRFEWADAPEDPVFLDVTHSGYMSVRKHRVVVSEKELVIVLGNLVSITGTVSETQTEKPVDEFSRYVRHPTRGWGDTLDPREHDRVYCRFVRSDHRHPPELLPGFCHRLRVEGGGSRLRTRDFISTLQGHGRFAGSELQITASQGS